MIVSFRVVILRKNHMKNKSKLLFLTKIVSILVISWLCLYYNDEITTCKSLVYGSKIDISLDRTTQRVLARYEKRNDLMNPKIKYQTHDNREKYILAHGRESNNTYEQLKRGRSNNMEAYLKCYNQRYAIKKGIKKLDCYCEKKVFDKIDKVLKHIEQKNISEKHITKLLFKKYGLPLILLSLIPLFGIIIPIITSENGHILKNCKIAYYKKTGKHFIKHKHDDCTFMPIACKFLNNIIFILSIFMIIFIIIYTIIKIAKYERIKAGY